MFIEFQAVWTCTWHLKMYNASRVKKAFPRKSSETNLMQNVSSDGIFLQRRPAETLLLRESLERRSADHHDHLLPTAPSINPVRKSVDAAKNLSKAKFLVHYERGKQSHLTIDSKHEEFYQKHGLPSKPNYNPSGRRFTGSSESDPDFKPEVFKKDAIRMNARKSIVGAQNTYSAKEYAEVKAIQRIWSENDDIPTIMRKWQNRHSHHHHKESVSSTGSYVSQARRSTPTKFSFAQFSNIKAKFGRRSKVSPHVSQNQEENQNDSQLDTALPERNSLGEDMGQNESGCCEKLKNCIKSLCCCKEKKRAAEETGRQEADGSVYIPPSSTATSCTESNTSQV